MSKLSLPTDAEASKYYLTRGYSERLTDFFKYVNQLNELVNRNGWLLKREFNSYWCSFKKLKGRNVAFGIVFRENGTVLRLYLKRVKAEAEAFQTPDWYDPNPRNAEQIEYELKRGDADITPYVPLLELAYQRAFPENYKLKRTKRRTV